MSETADTALQRMTDEQLVGEYRSGRTEAFRELVHRYRRELFHFLIRFVGNRAAAEDLFQEAFLQVHLSADTFDLSRRFKPWLFTIAANKGRDHLRRNNRRQTAPLSALIDESQSDGRSFIDLLQADLPLPSDNVSRQEVQEQVRGVVSALPDHLREVLVMAYFNRMAYKEIAEVLTIPLGTVKSRLHAAVGTFAELWRTVHGEESDGQVNLIREMEQQHGG
jgi:RNA polymerase sigma-70 factor (ECF subfamily)